MPLINDPDDLSQGGITTPGDVAFTSSAGATTTMTGAASLPAVTAADYIELRDMDIAGNNGLYLVTGTPTTSSIDLTKQALTGAVVNPVNETANAAARVLGTNADEKNFHFDTLNRRFTFLNGFGSITVLDNAGVIGEALYSFFKLSWKNDNDLIKFPFPAIAITPEQYEFISGWLPVDEDESTIATGDASNTRSLIRSAGWDEVNVNGFLTHQRFGAVTLGNIDALDFAYFFWDSETGSTSYVFDGAVNEAIPSVIGTGADPGAGYDYTTSTIVRTGGSWITEGYEVGDSITVQGAAIAGNSVTAVISTVTALTITVVGTPFTVDANDTSAITAIDRRANVFTTRIRIFGKTYDESTSTAIGVTSITNQVYRFPLGEAQDNVIQDYADANNAGSISALFTDVITTPIAPFNDMSIGYYAAAQTRSGFVAIGGDTPTPGDAQFGIIIDGDVSQVQQDGGGAATAEQVYIRVQARLSGVADINDGAGAAAITLAGQLAEELLSLSSTGNTLSSILQTSNPGGAGELGVYVDSFDSNDTNRVAFPENGTDIRSFPFVASGNILFNANLSVDIDAVYRMFFTNDDAGDNSGRDFGTISAITVQDNTPADIAGAVPQLGGGSSLSFSYDYDGNVQRGAVSSGTDVPITIVAIGLSTGQYVVATGTIVRAVGQAFSLVAALERNFNNP